MESQLSRKKTELSKKIRPLILIIEDNTLVQKVYSRFLTMLDFSFDITESGLHALHLFKIGNYSAVLLDKELPDLDGTEVCRAMRQIEKEQLFLPIPIIAVTSDNSAREEFLSAGCNNFLIKPISVEDLRAVLGQRIFQSKKGSKKDKVNSTLNYMSLLATRIINQTNKECKPCLS